MRAYYKTIGYSFLCGALAVFTFGMILLVAHFVKKSGPAVFMFGAFGFVSLCVFIMRCIDLRSVYRIESALARGDYATGLRVLKFLLIQWLHDWTVSQPKIINYLGLFKRTYGLLNHDNGLALVGRIEGLLQESSAIIGRIGQVSNSEMKLDLTKRHERLLSEIEGLIFSLPIPRK